MTTETYDWDETTLINKTRGKTPYGYEEDTWRVIDRYFDEQPTILAHNQLDSYNDFIENIIPTLIKKDSPIVVEGEWDPETRKYGVRYEVEFDDVYMSLPQINEGSGTIRNLYPHEARLRGLTYSANLYLDVTHRIIRNGVVLDEKKEPKIPFKIPAMVKSKLCYLQNVEDESLIEMGECPYDLGGYFIINGSEKVIISQERPVDNKVLCFPQKSSNSKWDEVVEVRSTIDQRFYPVRNNTVSLTRPKEGESDQFLRVNFPYLTREIPLVVLFRAIGVTTDKEIMQLILMSLVETADDSVTQLIVPSLEELVEMDGKKRKIYTQHDALIFISRHVSINLEYLDKKLGTRATEEDKLLAKTQYILDILRRDLLPHCGPDFYRKAIYLGYMTRRLIECKLKIRDYDVRDHYANKRLDLPGPKLKQIFHSSFGRMVKEIKNKINKTMEDTGASALNNSLRKIIQNCPFQAPLKKALSTGDWGTAKNSNMFSSTNLGIAQVLQRLSYIGYVSHLRRVQTPMEKAGGKITEPRKLHPSQAGLLCPNETPEGQQVGIVKNLSLMTSVTISSSSLAIKVVLESEGMLPIDEMDRMKLGSLTKIFLNGEWLGVTNKAPSLYATLKELKTTGGFSPYTGIYWNHEHRELDIRCDGGRYSRPLYVVKRYGNQYLPKIAVEWQEAQNMSWDELRRGGYIEFVDPEECENCLIALNMKILQDNNLSNPEFKPFTHLEMHADMWNGAVAQMIPFSDHNPGPRNCYQSSMGKQALGLFCTNYNSRMDTMAHVLCYPQKPLVLTRTMKYLKLDRLPHGQQCVVAVACYTGYNQEDSVLMNKGAIERGKFNSLYFKTYVDEMNPHKSSTSESEQFGIPNPNTTQIRKHGSYDHLDENGFAKIGARVNVNDIIIGKTVKLREPIKRATGGLITHSDVSTQLKTGDDGFVDKRIPSPGSVKNFNSDNNPFAKIRIAQYRQPVIGDKVACYSGDTEVLTKKGWKLMKNVKMNDQLFTYDYRTGFYNYRAPTKVHHYANEFKKMYKIEKEGINLLVTPNHRMFVRVDGEKSYRFIRADEIGDQVVYYQTDQTFSKNGEVRVDHQRYCSIVTDTSDVYCVTVPTDIVYVRRGSGKGVWCGNSRHAQKGTVGLILPEEDMPFTDSGLRPDLIMNPHALPSRMTIGQWIESVLGKTAALEAEVKDSTPFTYFNKDEIGDTLEKYGFHRDGEEVLYNGFTGQQLKVTIFIGVTYYQRLKHMVKDKVHARATGRVNNMTKQSVEGRGVGGGLRLGEMERDCFIAHGIAQFLKERFMDSADKFRVFVGKESQNIVVGNPDIDLYLYNDKQLNPEDVAEVQLPHAMKLLLHELISMGIDIRLMTEDKEGQ